MRKNLMFKKVGKWPKEILQWSNLKKVGGVAVGALLMVFTGGKLRKK